MLLTSISIKDLHFTDVQEERVLNHTRKPHKYHIFDKTQYSFRDTMKMLG